MCMEVNVNHLRIEPFQTPRAAMAIPACGVGHFRVRRWPSPHAAFGSPFEGGILQGVSGHRIIPAASPRMAPEQPSQGEPRTFQRAVLPQSLDGILAACGREAARGRRQRRDEALVKADRQDEQLHQ